ncbi:ATP-binding protein [Salinarimonas sp. NSM]|uniref:ATP-binding protein n=1 Tax=Salinarimonas sp. NSM TaxID=3458003 RepID=UPI004035A46D
MTRRPSRRRIPPPTRPSSNEPDAVGACRAGDPSNTNSEIVPMSNTPEFDPDHGPECNDPQTTMDRLNRLTVPRPEDKRARKLFNGLLRADGAGRPIPQPKLFGLNREARGLVITGASGAGKSTLVCKLFRGHPAFPGFDIPGHECKILSLIVPSPANLKSLGHTVLDRLGWQVGSRSTERFIWKTVKMRLHELGYSVVHFDEAQRLLRNGSDMEIDKICDNWVDLMQQPNPMILVLSGVEGLLAVVNGHKHARRRFDRLPLAPISTFDAKTIEGAIAGYCKEAGIGFDRGDHVVQRLIHACNSTFGTSIEMTLKAIEEAITEGDGTLTVAHFAEAYCARSGCLPFENPFLVEDWHATHAFAADKDDGDDTDEAETAGKGKGKK